MYHSFLIHSSADGQSRLLPCPGYYKQCCNEHWGTWVSFNSGFLSVYAQQWDCWVVWQFYFQFLRNLHTVLHMAALVCIPTNSVRGFPFLHTLSRIYLNPCILCLLYWQADTLPPHQTSMNVTHAWISCLWK